MKKTFQWKEFLRTHPIVGTLRDDKRIDALLKDDVSWERTYAKDDVIVRQREVGISVFLIGSGTAEATLELSEGPPISLSVMRPRSKPRSPARSWNLTAGSSSSSWSSIRRSRLASC